MSGAGAADPYEALAELAEAALVLAEQDRVEELEAVFARSEALTATLPEQAPQSARPALERAAAAQERLRTRLGESLFAARSEMNLVARGRRAAHAYGGSAASALDLQA